MLTPNSLTDRTRRYSVTMRVAVLVFVVLLGIDNAVARWTASSLSSLGFGVSSKPFALILMAIIFASLVGADFIARKRCLPRCPSCGKAFYPSNVELVVATKHCPYCAAQVIS
jgi:hypothetical protein